MTTAKDKVISRTLVKKESFQNSKTSANQTSTNGGFISVLLLTIEVFFTEAIVSILAYLFISK